MLRSCLFMAAVLPLMLCCDAAAGQDGDDGIRYAAYHSEWGEALTPLVARSIHLELTRAKLNVSLYGGMPPLVYTGPVDGKTRAEIDAFLDGIQTD